MKVLGPSAGDLRMWVNTQNSSFWLFWRNGILNSVNCALQYSDMLLMEAWEACSWTVSLTWRLRTKRKFKLVNKKVMDTEPSSEDGSSLTSAVKKNICKETAGNEIFLFILTISYCVSLVLFPLCLKNVLKTLLNAFLVTMTLWIFQGAFSPVRNPVISEYPDTQLSILTVYQVHKIHGDVVKHKAVDKPNKYGWPAGHTFKSCAVAAGAGDGPAFSQEPKFPASMLLGVSFGLALWGGGEGLLGVRQGREVGILRRAKSLHQWLQLVLLQFEVQLYAAAKKGETNDQLVVEPSSLGKRCCVPSYVLLYCISKFVGFFFFWRLLYCCPC